MSGSANGHPQDRLSEYLDDELSIEDRSAIDRHLASCEDCRSHLEALRRLASAIGEEPVPPLPADLHEKIGRRLDEAAVLRPRRWRFALPATIAATISAIGILIAVQWREGRLAPPNEQEAARQTEAREDKKLSDAAPMGAPTATPTLLPPAAPAPPPPPARDERFAQVPKEKTDLDAALKREGPKDTGTVVGGVAGSAEDALEEDTGGAHENRAPAPAAPPQASAVDRAEPGRFLQKQASMAAAPASICNDHWSDSGARGTWEVPDPVSTARELDAIAHNVGGLGLWRGVDDGRPYLLIVPRARYAEVFHLLRARGISGLTDPPTLAAGDGCTALSITITSAR